MAEPFLLHTTRGPVVEMPNPEAVPTATGPGVEGHITVGGSVRSFSGPTVGLLIIALLILFGLHLAGFRGMSIAR